MSLGVGRTPHDSETARSLPDDLSASDLHPLVCLKHEKTHIHHGAGAHPRGRVPASARSKQDDVRQHPSPASFRPHLSRLTRARWLLGSRGSPRGSRDSSRSPHRAAHPGRPGRRPGRRPGGPREERKDMGIGSSR